MVNIRLALLLAALPALASAFQIQTGLLRADSAHASASMCRSRVPAAVQLRLRCSLSNPKNEQRDFPARTALFENFDARAAISAMALSAALFVTPVAVSAESFSGAELLLAAETQKLPDGWSSALTEDGQEYYYNIQSGVSQWEFPEVPKQQKAEKKKKAKSDKSQDLREIVQFEAPAVPVDRITVREKPKLLGKCGETDFRVNSEECGEEARNLVEDTAAKSADTIGVITSQGIDGLKEKASKAEERSRMLQEAEMNALKKTALFQKVDAATKDPEKAAARKKQIDEVTQRNDLGSRQAPWSAPDDPDGPPEKIIIELPKLELPVPKFSLPKFSMPSLGGGGKPAAEKPAAQEAAAPVKESAAPVKEAAPKAAPAPKKVEEAPAPADDAESAAKKQAEEARKKEEAKKKAAAEAKKSAESKAKREAELRALVEAMPEAAE